MSQCLRQTQYRHNIFCYLGTHFCFSRKKKWKFRLFMMTQVLKRLSVMKVGLKCLCRLEVLFIVDLYRNETVFIRAAQIEPTTIFNCTPFYFLPIWFFLKLYYCFPPDKCMSFLSFITFSEYIPFPRERKRRRKNKLRQPFGYCKNRVAMTVVASACNNQVWMKFEIGR